MVGIKQNARGRVRDAEAQKFAVLLIGSNQGCLVVGFDITDILDGMRFVGSLLYQIDQGEVCKLDVVGVSVSPPTNAAPQAPKPILLARPSEPLRLRARETPLRDG